jgi:hypothetical protein
LRRALANSPGFAATALKELKALARSYPELGPLLDEPRSLAGGALKID